MKYGFIKIFWFFVSPLRKFYWFIFRPKTRGVKCIIENNEKFLLVKLNYAHRLWTFPGGKVNRKESYMEAGIRETKEETGIIIKDLVYVDFYKANKEYKDDTVEIYYGNSSIIETKIDLIEIEKADWFRRDSLPENRATAVDKIFKIYDEFRLK